MKFAFVFPGQGSQSLGMMAGYGDAAAPVRETFTEASDVLGQDLWAMVAEGSEDALNLTVNTQPAMLAAGVAVYRLWQSMGGQTPSMMAGHSLGEYTALVCANALSFSDAIKLVRLRAEAMQSAVPEGVGAMAALLGLDEASVRAVCVEAAENEVLQAANYNSPGQVVIAGNKAAVARACLLAKAKGAKRALPLPLSVPSHCALMQPAAEKLREALASTEFRQPSVTVLHNVDVSAHVDPATLRDILVQQLYSPVRWVETVQAFAQEGMELIAECGPGKVLTGLNKRIVTGVQCVALPDTAAMNAVFDTSFAAVIVDNNA